MSDELLLEAIKKNDNGAFKEFFNKYYSSLVSYIITFTNDSSLAEDIVQQTFITIWEQRHNLETNKSIKSYLYKISYNSYIDHYRKTKRQDSFFDDLRQQALRNQINENYDIAEKRTVKLKSIIEDLPPRCKEILLLNKTQGLKYEEIAKLLNISNKTVESQMRIAFKKIRQGFENTNLFMVFVTNKLKGLHVKTKKNDKNFKLFF